MPRMNLIRCSALMLAVLMLGACSKTPEETADVATDDAYPIETALAVPETRVAAVEDVYHGQTVVDPYRWLEDWEDPAVKAWSETQNTYARAALAGLPERPAVHARISEILRSAQSVVYSSLRLAGADALFAIKRDPTKQQSILVLMGADGDPAARARVYRSE